MKPRILVVAADAQLRATLARWLMAAGYGVELAESPKRAREVLAGSDIILALLAPDMLGDGGAALANELASEIEHLIVIAEQVDETVGETVNTIAAEDTLRKPLSEPEVLARIKAVVGDEEPEPERGISGHLAVADYVLDLGGRTCHDREGNEILLTRAEFSLLLAFARQPGQVLTRDQISHAVTGRGLTPDDRSVDVLVSRVRRKIEPDSKTPRIILTVPGEGYKLAASPQAVPATGPKPDTVLPARDQSPRVHQQEPEPTPSPARRMLGARTLAAIGTGGAVLAFAVGFFLYLGFAPRKEAAPAQKFDAAAIPFVYENARTQLADYAHEPDAKAIAISREGWGLSSGDADIESAKTEALARCRDRDKGGYCRLYAVGNEVVWTNSMLALPGAADIRAELAQAPLTADDLVKIWQSVWRVRPPDNAAKYVSAANHKAMAVSGPSFYVSTARPTRAEAVRIAIERCSDVAKTPCLLLSVEGLLTVPIPQLYRIIQPFTLAGERQMTDVDRERIAAVYAGKDWRALAKGQSGHWYAVGGIETEAASAEAALKSCRAAEPTCELYAIGNFRVGEKLEANPGG